MNKHQRRQKVSCFLTAIASSVDDVLQLWSHCKWRGGFI